MRTVVSGSSGLVGSALLVELSKANHEVVRLVRTRRRVNASAIYWRPPTGPSDTGELDTGSLTRVDSVINLAGENIAQARWTKAAKQRIRDSRINGTRLLCETLARLKSPPKVLVSVSGIGYYGDRGDELLDENALPGKGFLAEVCRDWEASVQPAVDAGIRVVLLRIGMVLSPRGGALTKMLPVFRFGFGGKLGSGRQYMSWVSVSDLTGIILMALQNDSLSGPVNAVAPNPVTNREFTQMLGRLLKRPTILSQPASILRVMMGEMADEMLLSSTRVTPSKLQKHGYQFSCPDIETALRGCLEK